MIPVPWNTIALVSFDAFGTLVRFDAPRRPFVRLVQLLKDRGVSVPDDARTWAMSRSLGMRDLADALGGSSLVLDAEWQALEADLALEANGLTVFDESLTTLSVLRQRGYRLAITSNLAEPYVGMVEKALPGVAFDVPAWSCRVGAVKPSPAVFAPLLASVLSPGRLLHIGDTWSDDVLGATAVGAVPVFLDRRTPRSPTDPLWWFTERDGLVVPTVGRLDALLDVLPLQAPVVLPSLQAAIQRGHAWGAKALDRAFSDPTLLDVNDVAQRLRCPVEHVLEQCRSGRFLALERNGEMRLPSWQFTTEGVHPVLSAAWQRWHGTTDPTLVWHWMTSPHDLLNGERAVDLIAQGAWGRVSTWAERLGQDEQGAL